MMSKNCLLNYYDLNKLYGIENDFWNYQMGALIKKELHPVTYLLWNMWNSQINYTTKVKTTQSIVKCLK